MVFMVSRHGVSERTAHAACDEATLHGTYVYSYTGFTGSGSSAIRFAVAGSVTFNGDGTEDGISTTSTEGQKPGQPVSFMGTYTVKPDCTATETDTDQNGGVTHFDDFTDLRANTVSFIQVDPNVVSAGTETRGR